jgi:DNA-directed RNA polymerase specialized sigma24 family protein
MTFCGFVIEELAPKVQASLRLDFRLSLEEAEDCFSTALERFLSRSNSSVINPQAYLWTSARHQACDLVEERSRFKSDEPEETADDRPEHAPHEPSVVLVEALVEDIEAEGAWASEVVGLAVARLRPALRRVVRLLLDNNLEYDAANASNDLGMTPQTFRANKSYAFAALRHTIPQVIEELGVEPRVPRAYDIFSDHAFLKDEDDHA